MCIHSPWKTKCRLIKFHAAVVQLRVHSVEFLVLLRFTFPVPVVGAENTKKSPARAASRSRKILSRLVGTSIHLWAFLLAMMSVMSGKKIQYQNENLLANRSAWHIYIYIYLWYQESGLNYVGQGMITGRQVFLYYLSRKRLDWTQCMVGDVC